jgi:protein-S-isoprenylcysteine O-methyltransferase Ste14
VSIWATLGAESLAITPPPAVQLIGAAALLLALALYQWAAISIRGRMFSYAGNSDLPQFVHRSGPYAYVRNPFYLSYLLAEIATVVMWPSVWGGVIVVLATVYFQWLARFEEGKFARSTVAVEYAQYKARTGRLLPPLKRRA